MEIYHWMTSVFQNVYAGVTSYFVSDSDSDSQENPAIFTEEELSEYTALTYLTKEQILRAYTNFCSMEPQYFIGKKNPFMPRAKVMEMPEFKVNPLKDRMMSVFATYEDFMTFEDYLDMMSVFSMKAPLDLKAEYAFRIYDFDEDDLLSAGDLIKLVKQLKGNKRLEEKEIKEAAVRVLRDADVDEDGLLAFTEFYHMVARMDDFKSFVAVHGTSIKFLFKEIIRFIFGVSISISEYFAHLHAQNILLIVYFTDCHQEYKKDFWGLRTALRHNISSSTVIHYSSVVLSIHESSQYSVFRTEEIMKCLHHQYKVLL